MSAATPPSTPVMTDFLDTGAKSSPPIKQKSLSGKGQKISRQKHIQLDEDRQSQLSLDKMLKVNKARDSPPVLRPLVSILTPKAYTSHTLPRKSDSPAAGKQKKKNSGKKQPQHIGLDESTVSLIQPSSMTSSVSPPQSPAKFKSSAASNTSASLQVSTTMSRKSSASSVRFDNQPNHPVELTAKLLVVATKSCAVDKNSMNSIISSSETGLTSLNLYETDSSVNLVEPVHISPHHGDDSGILAQNSPVSPGNNVFSKQFL